MKKQFWLALILVFGVLALGGFSSRAQFQDTTGQPGSGTSTCPTTCNYCCEDNCGCSVPDGYAFTGWCACSSLSCYRVCSVSPPRS